MATRPPESRDEARLARVLRQQLRADQLLGVDAVPVADVALPEAAPVAPPTPVLNAGRAASEAPPAPAAPPATPIATTGDKAAQLAQLREHLLANEAVTSKCPPGTKVVFGEGDPESPLMFIGEGPGAEEAREGRPFVGPAGQLLDKMITAMGLTRESVYITNMVNFRPPNNRVPTPDEVALCEPYCLGQVKVVRPTVIVALGGTAAKHLLDTTTGITRLRGSFKPFTRVEPAIDLMPTFHPAFLLRQYTVDNRKRAWEDLQQVMGKLGMTG